MYKWELTFAMQMPDFVKLQTDYDHAFLVICNLALNS
jgi:hypothetical protein